MLNKVDNKYTINFDHFLFDKLAFKCKILVYYNYLN